MRDHWHLFSIFFSKHRVFVCVIRERRAKDREKAKETGEVCVWECINGGVVLLEQQILFQGSCISTKCFCSLSEVILCRCTKTHTQLSEHLFGLNGSLYQTGFPAAWKSPKPFFLLCHVQANTVLYSQVLPLTFRLTTPLLYQAHWTEPSVCLSASYTWSSLWFHWLWTIKYFTPNQYLL